MIQKSFEHQGVCGQCVSFRGWMLVILRTQPVHSMFSMRCGHGRYFDPEHRVQNLEHVFIDMYLEYMVVPPRMYICEHVVCILRCRIVWPVAKYICGEREREIQILNIALK